MSGFAYLLFLTFCDPTAPFGCKEQLHGTYPTSAQCTEAAAKLVEPGTPAMLDDQGWALESAICRRADSVPMPGQPNESR